MPFIYMLSISELCCYRLDGPQSLKYLALYRESLPSPDLTCIYLSCENVLQTLNERSRQIYTYTKRKKLYSEIRSSPYIHSVGVNMRVGKDFRNKSPGSFVYVLMERSIVSSPSVAVQFPKKMLLVLTRPKVEDIRPTDC